MAKVVLASLDIDGDDILVDVGVCLERWPIAAKFLKAMRRSKFDPRSSFFDVGWTAARAQRIPPREAWDLVKEVLYGADARSECQFVQIYGKLTRLVDSWQMFDMEFLQALGPGVELFKHCLCQHWLELARNAAVSMVSKDPIPIILHYKEGTGSDNDCCYIVGRSLPHPLDTTAAISQKLTDSLRCGFEWRFISRALLFWDWDFPEEGLGSGCTSGCLESFEEACRVGEEKPPDFLMLGAQDILRMVHVQLRLSSCGLAEVHSRSNTLVTLIAMKVLASLLNYELKLLQFQTDLEALEHEFRCFEEQYGQDNLDHRGAMIVIYGLPLALKDDITFVNQSYRWVLVFN
eukprot:Skav225894  [mRNA]  locus=scaffold1460:227824:229535:- [translate_table: standard]